MKPFIRLFSIIITFAVILNGMAFDAYAASSHQDGLYSISAATNARMFKITKTILRIEDGKMYATVTMSGSGYGYLFVGTAEEAAQAPKSQLAPYRVNEQGTHEFTVEIPVLDKDIEMASYSIKYDKWYDRIVSFDSKTLNEYVQTAKDGTYSAKVISDTLKAEQCVLEVKDKKMTATITADGKETTVDVPSLDLRFEAQIGSKAHTIRIDSYSMVPVQMVPADGEYKVTVESDSGLFKITDAAITATDGSYTVKITAHTDKYAAVFAGTAAEALYADESLVVYADEAMTFEIPVSSLDQPVSVATYDESKKRWYDRELTFLSSTLADQNGNAPVLTMVVPEIEDEQAPELPQTEEISFAFKGGTGKVKISCEELQTIDGQNLATLVFDSIDYTYAVVDGVQYDNENKGGNSTFTVPVNINGETVISAETVKMSDAHLIDYTLYIYIDGTDAQQFAEESVGAEEQNETVTDLQTSGANSVNYILVGVASVSVIVAAVAVFKRKKD